MQVANVITYEQANILCAIINRFSSGGHPVASVDGLKFFELQFVKRLAKRARPSLKPYAQVTLDEALVALSKKN
jgi:hypothetical protein